MPAQNCIAMMLREDTNGPQKWFIPHLAGDMIGVGPGKEDVPLIAPISFNYHSATPC